MTQIHTSNGGSRIGIRDEAKRSRWSEAFRLVAFPGHSSLHPGFEGHCGGGKRATGKFRPSVSIIFSGAKILALLLALSIACATPPGPSLGSVPPAELFEAVFRYQVDKTPRDVLRASEVLFFQVDDEDPSADLLDRLSDLPLPALPHSVMQSSKIVDLAEPTRFFEKGTGRRGNFFWAGNVTRLRTIMRPSSQVATVPFARLFSFGKWMTCGKS